MNTLEKSRNTIKAAELLELGLRTSIVVQETGLSAEAVRQIHREVNQSPPKSGQLPDIESIIKTKRAQIEASLLLSIYQKLDTAQHRKVDIDNLQKAYDFYQNLRGGLKLESSRWKSFSINEAWILVRAYLIEQVTIDWCQCGACSLQYAPAPIAKCLFCGETKKQH